ncbi:hypothetical protein H634G_05022 [Metarhizium anisopliae BRIP 53293]|uniref:Uncharacterized protein n=1 Tax=Metarhizium anisopliae BRIP 53293 TaxID=1291518 RepID=A0A0D9P012_METAN|nr:hypothetical protein H634G_05022 [Metarhizium anisopliae BRIP 53293]KJK89435.1 hypothetical protein H633G_06684 [Metarhizium anisopliae BRIP 53284]
MLTFAGRPKSSVFGSHRIDTSPPMEGEGGGGGARGGGASSRFKRLSFMMHSPRLAHGSDSDMSPMSSVPPKGVQPDAKLATKTVAKINTETDTTKSVDAKFNAALDASASYFPPPSKLDIKQGSSDDFSADVRKASISFPDELPKPDHSPSDRTPTDALSESSFGRKSSVSSISFRRSRNPSVAPSTSKQTAHGLRIRNASPPPQR